MDPDRLEEHEVHPSSPSQDEAGLRFFIKIDCSHV